MNAYDVPRRIALGARKLLPGLGLAVATALVATYLGGLLPLVGAPVLAIVLGVALRARFEPRARDAVGLAYAAKAVLQHAIVLSGFGLSFVAVLRTSLATLPVTAATVGAALLLAGPIGRLLRLDGAVRRLIGVGTAICGASAIAAVASVVEPTEAELAVSIATIFLYNVAAVLLFPPIGHLLHLSQAAFGVWAGTAINDTSSVVAAGYAYGHAAGREATIVKLARATLILPIVAAFAYRRARATRAVGERIAWKKIAPWFIGYFLIAAIANSAGLVPAAWHAPLATAAGLLIATALAAIGWRTPWRVVANAGVGPLALGFALWIAVAVISLAVQRATGL